MTYREMAKKWRHNKPMAKLLYKYHRKTDPNYLGRKWVGSIEK